jgi:hypothetical protein
MEWCSVKKKHRDFAFTFIFTFYQLQQFYEYIFPPTSVQLFTTVSRHNYRFMHETVVSEGNSGEHRSLTKMLKRLPIKETTVCMDHFYAIKSLPIAYQPDQR